VSGGAEPRKGLPQDAPRQQASSAQEPDLRSTAGRKRKNSIFVGICVATAFLSVVLLAVLLVSIAIQGKHYLFDPSPYVMEVGLGEGYVFTFGLYYPRTEFLTNVAHRDPDKAGISPALWGSVWVCTGCALFTLPLGVATAIFLEEFRPRFWLLKWIHSFIQLNITNLAGVPSVVYGIIGITAFAAMFGLFDASQDGETAGSRWEIGIQYYHQYLTEGEQVVLVPAEGENAPPKDLTDEPEAMTPGGERVELNVIGPDAPLPEDEELLDYTLRSTATGGEIDRRRWYYLSLPFGDGVITGSLTLMLVVLPVVIIATQESLRAVPDSLREGALGMGATRWQMVWNVTLPAAIPGIMTGSILAMSRAIGEAAPILMISGIVFIDFTPGHLMDKFTVMPLQIYNWAQRPQPEFHHLAASGIIVLLTVLLAFNALAVFIRQKFQKPLS